MENKLSIISSIVLSASAAGARDEVAAWVSCLCAAAIAITSCALNIYRMIKMRDHQPDDDEHDEHDDDDEKGGE